MNPDISFLPFELQILNVRKIRDNYLSNNMSNEFD